MLDLRLELLGTIFGFAELQRQLMGEIERAIAVFLGGTGSLIEQPDDGLAGAVELDRLPAAIPSRSVRTE